MKLGCHHHKYPRPSNTTAQVAVWRAALRNHHDTTGCSRQCIAIQCNAAL